MNPSKIFTKQQLRHQIVRLKKKIVRLESQLEEQKMENEYNDYDDAPDPDWSIDYRNRSWGTEKEAYWHYQQSTDWDDCWYYCESFDSWEGTPNRGLPVCAKTASGSWILL